MTDLLHHLTTRRTVPSAKLSDPGPSRDEITQLLTVASRVPDHGKLSPWRFIVIEGAARARLGAEIGEIYRDATPEADPEKIAKQSRPFEPAPVVVCVVSTASDHPKIPLWEQELTAGAVCLNLMHGAHALGFSAQWLTGFAAFDDRARAALSLAPGERVAGFIHIGTPSEPPAERSRPDVAALTTYLGDG